MEINAEYLRELSDIKAPTLEMVDYILSECEVIAKEGYYRKSFKHLDCMLDIDKMKKVMNILEKKGLQADGLERDSVSLKYSFDISWDIK